MSDDITTVGFDAAPTPEKIKPEREEYDLHRHEPHRERNVITFAVPNTLPKARSAYCHDPTFQLAVDVYSQRHGGTAEEVLKNNLQMNLTVESSLMGVAESDLKPEITVSSEVAQTETDETNENEGDEKKDEPTVMELKQQYVEGEINIWEFEDKVEDVIDVEKRP